MSRKPLTRERVLRAAIELADADGIDALSMRRLARTLGVEAMSLYNHVENKDDLLSGMVDLVIGEIPLPRNPGNWKRAIRRYALATRDVALSHGWASTLWMSRAGGSARLRHSDWLLQMLRRAGLSKARTFHAYHILEAYVLGFTTMQLTVERAGEGADLRDMAESFLLQLPGDEYPDFAEHVRQHLKPPGGTGGFELGLDLILDGLEASLLNAQGPSSS